MRFDQHFVLYTYHKYFSTAEISYNATIFLFKYFYYLLLEENTYNLIL